MATTSVTANRLAVALGSTQSEQEVQYALDLFNNGSSAVSGTPLWASILNGITANAGGGQANAVVLSGFINRVTTVGTAADSVKLPVSQAGQMLIVINAAAANAMNLYPATGESINALSANTALSVAANKMVIAVADAAGHWHTVLTA